MSVSTRKPGTGPSPAGQPAEKKGMSTGTKWLIAIVGLVAVGGLAVLLGILSILPTRVVVDPQPGDPVVDPTEVVIPDGDWFGFVTVGRDESGAITLGVDLAEMLTGQEAHDAAVDAGVIGEDEDLPNDFFIANPESRLELMHLADAALIEVISSDDVSKTLVIEPGQLEALYEGDYVGPDVYGIVPGQPIAMDITISDGLITAVTAIYLP